MSLSRRKRLLLLGMIVLAVLAVPSGILLLAQSHGSMSGFPFGRAERTSPVDYVDPFIGTDTRPQERFLGGFAGGNVFPGAVYPHGMVQWSPDTTTAPGGYRYSHTAIHGFSLTHFSGRGCAAYQDIPFMPTVGPLTVSPTDVTAYAASFSHAREVAAPGYYSIHLETKNIDVALSTTARTGMAQFTYPATKDAMLLINTSGSATGNARHGTAVQIVGNNQVVGSASSGHFCGRANTYTVYFAAQFDTPFTSFGVWRGNTIMPQVRLSDGKHSGAYLTFDTTGKQLVQVKVGISFVSVANARLNLEKENAAWNFQAVRSKASAAWNERLRQVEISGGTQDEKTIFYTALYHTLIHPNIFNDVNGQYLGFDNKVHTAQGYTQYENFPGWDMYRSLIGLLSILDPTETGDMMRSLLADAEQGGGALPRWEVANDNSAGMVGDSADVLLATSYAFGVRNFAAQEALKVMVAGASKETVRSGKYHPREGLSDYLKLGYVSMRTGGSASITLEYATDDFAIAQLARALGQQNIYTTYMQRSQNWKRLFDTGSGYIRPRNADGSFQANFDPTSGDGFVEGNAAQYIWMVPHDLPGLCQSMGSNARVVQRLDEHFAQLNKGPRSRYAFMGNEPEFVTPWVYNFVGAPYRTQDVIRRIQQNLFQATPAGLPGNDDGGAMSSWYIFTTLGLYPVIPGVAGFSVGSPLFDSVTIHLRDGHNLSIQGQGAAEAMRYVRSLHLNGQAYTRAWLPFNSLKNGARLQFELSATPVENALHDPFTAV